MIRSSKKQKEFLKEIKATYERLSALKKRFEESKKLIERNTQTNKST